MNKKESIQLAPGAVKSHDSIRIGTPPVTRPNVADIDAHGLTSLTNPELSLRNKDLLS